MGGKPNKKTSSNSKENPLHKLCDDAIAKALSGYPHSSTSDAKYYREIRNRIVLHPLFITPFGNNDDERKFNAKHILDRFFRSDRHSPFRIKASSFERSFRVKEDDQPVIFKFGRQEGNAESLNAPIGTIIVVGSAIPALLEKYEVHKEKILSESRVAPSVAPPAAAVTLEFHFKESVLPEQEDESSVISIGEDDEELNALARNLAEVKSKRKKEAETAEALEKREAKIARFAEKIKKEQEVLKNLQQRNTQVNGRIQTQLTGAKALVQGGMFRAPPSSNRGLAEPVKDVQLLPDNSAPPTRYGSST